MARNEALLRLHQRLVAQRDELHRKLSQENLVSEHDNGIHDAADEAFIDVERELNSQLASLETRELRRIQKAIEAIREGRYGKCDVCERSIPVARLRALPYTTTCVACQRSQELTGDARHHEADWESAWEYQARQSDRELTLQDIVLDE